jgi:mono/diheme cytochrome c family protein
VHALFSLRRVGLLGVLAMFVWISSASLISTGRELQASAPWRFGHHGAGPGCAEGYTGEGEWEGTWYWLRSPEQEQRVVASLYNRYCVRCHGVDGRGVWDIPDVPDFTNAHWQASRSDGQLVRLTLEGRGAVMPPFRGTLSLEETWAMARYLRTFVPGTELSRPDLGPKEQPTAVPEVPAPKKLEVPAK